MKLPFYLQDLPDSYETNGFVVVLNEFDFREVVAGRVEFLASAGDKTVALFYQNDSAPQDGWNKEYPVAAFKDYTQIRKVRITVTTTELEKRGRKLEQISWRKAERKFRRDARKSLKVEK